MKEKSEISRRSFIRNGSLGLGGGIVGITSCGLLPDKSERIPRRICAATIDLKEFRPVNTREARIRTVFNRLNEVAALKPDIICLPESFNSIWVTEKIPVAELAVDEKDPGDVCERVSVFANDNNCYIVCPVYTKKDGKFYNSSILFDRTGQIAGVYNKIHPSKEEMIPADVHQTPVTPGALDQPVIETDFGNAGMQINEDIHWSDGWESLKKQGVEVILYSTALSAGRMLNYYAWKTNSYIIASAAENAVVVDMSGNILDSSSLFTRYAWTHINLDKVNIETWPANERIPQICKEFGDKIDIKVWGSTEVITIESRSADIDLREVLKKFKLQTIDEVVETSRIVQDRWRPEI